MLTKELFLEYTGRLDVIRASHEAKSKALQTLSPECEVFYDSSKEIALILDLLTEFFPHSKWGTDEPYKSDIEWFYYDYLEAPVKHQRSLECTYNDKEYSISSWNDLYEFLTVQENENEKD